MQNWRSTPKAIRKMGRYPVSWAASVRGQSALLLSPATTFLPKGWGHQGENKQDRAPVCVLWQGKIPEFIFDFGTFQVLWACLIKRFEYDECAIWSLVDLAPSTMYLVKWLNGCVQTAQTAQLPGWTGWMKCWEWSSCLWTVSEMTAEPMQVRVLSDTL